MFAKVSGHHIAPCLLNQVTQIHSTNTICNQDEWTKGAECNSLVQSLNPRYFHNIPCALVYCQQSYCKVETSWNYQIPPNGLLCQRNSQIRTSELLCVLSKQIVSQPQQIIANNFHMRPQTDASNTIFARRCLLLSWSYCSPQSNDYTY